MFNLFRKIRNKLLQECKTDNLDLQSNKVPNQQAQIDGVIPLFGFKK
jgi:hypothetical protein